MTSLVDINPDHLRVVQKILRENLPSGVAVWVFGSRADWATKDTSDLDLALEGDSALDHGTISALEMAFEESDLPYRVDIIDLNHVSDKFRQIVNAQKIPLPMAENWGSVKDIRHEIVLDEVIDTKKVRTEWLDMPFSEAVLVNPQMRLEHGKIYPFVNMSTVRVGSRNVYPSEKRVFNGSGSRFRDGDTLMARITHSLEHGNIYSYCAPKDSRNAHGSTEFIVIRGRTNITDNDYAYYLTKWDGVREYAVAQMTGTSGRQRVPTMALDHLMVSIPPLVDQRAIAYILRTLDDKIDLNRRMNKTLEAMSRALFKSWFVDFDPVRAKMDGRWRCGESLLGLPAEHYDIFPDCLVDSGLGGVPKGWRATALGRLIDVVGGSTPSTKEAEYWKGGTHCWATPKDLSDLSAPVLLGTKRRITNAGLEKISSGLLPPGTLLLSARAPIGYLAINEVPTAINQDFIAMLPSKTVSNLFMLCWCSIYQDEITNYANDSNFLEISKSSFRLIKAVMPDQKIMTKFDNYVRPLYEHMVSNERESQTLMVQRDVLLPKLISGEFRVAMEKRSVDE